MESSQDNPAILPTLGSTPRDEIVRTTSSFVGAIPFAGPILTEVITQLIPQQRQERLEEYVRQLETRIEGIERTQVYRRSVIELFEDGAFLAVRSHTTARISQIANVVADGMSGEEHKTIEAKRMLNLLEEIDEEQVVHLSASLHKNRRNREFHETHATILRPKAVGFGSSREELDAHTLQQMAKQKLVRLGLLNQNFKRSRPGELPEFDDKTGMIKASGHSLTPLGRLFLRYLGLAEPDDY